jgi:hypothetical protein
MLPRRLYLDFAALAQREGLSKSAKLPQLVEKYVAEVESRGTGAA